MSVVWLRRGAMAALAVAAVGAPALLVGGTGYVYAPLASERAATEVGPPGGGESLRREQQQIEAKLRGLAPRGPYVVIDRVQNRMLLRQGERVLRSMICSAGSGRILEEPGGQRRTWVFQTPIGEYRVLAKMDDPAWRKPDWAFIEEGEPIPEDPAQRIEYGALGEHGIYFGDGYLIHGTPYERLLGRSVTHGCIRLGRDDLRAVYRAVPIGTRIYIH